MRTTKLNRRNLLLGTAAGAATLAASGSLPAPNQAAAADAVKLEFWSPANDPNGSEIITKLVNDFNSSVGTQQGISANLSIKPAPNSDYTQYTTAMTSSGSPDVIMTYTYNPVAAWAANGFIQPLDDYVQAAGIKEEDFFPIAWTMINFGGHIWGLLQEFDFNQFWWNKSIHAGDAPKTIDDLDKIAADYNKTDSSGNLTQAGFIPWMNFTGPDWNPVFGGSWYDFTNRKWTIDDPKNQAFLEWFLKYVDLFGGRDKSDALESSVPKTYGDIFQYGKVAFALEGEYLPAELKKQQLELDYGITQLPVSGDVPPGTATTGGGNLFLLPTKAAKAKEAVSLIQYMGTGKAVLDWCVPNSNIPPTKAAATDPSFTSQLPELKPWIDTLNMDHMVPPIPSPQYAQFYQLLTDAVDQVTYKKKTPEQALADVATQTKDAVDQFKQAHPDWEGE